MKGNNLSDPAHLHEWSCIPLRTMNTSKNRHFFHDNLIFKETMPLSVQLEELRHESLHLPREVNNGKQLTSPVVKFANMYVRIHLQFGNSFM